MNELMIKVTSAATPDIGEAASAFLDLHPGTTLSFEINNPIFNTDIIEGAYSFPVNIPASPRNRRLLGLLSPLQTRGQLSVSIPCEIFDTGILAMIGTLRIQQVNALNIQIFILTSQSIIASLATKSLRTLDFGGKKKVDEAYEFYVIQFAGTTGDVTVTINGTDYTTAFVGSLENTVKLIAESVALDADIAEAVAYGDILFLRYTDTYTSGDFIVTAAETGDLTDTELMYNDPGTDANETNATVQRHMTNAAHNLVPGRHTATFFPVYNPGFYNDGDADYFNKQNYWYNGEFPYDWTLVPTATGTTHSPVTPFPYLKQVIYKIFETAGYIIEDSFFDAELETLCLYSTQSLDIKENLGSGDIAVNNDEYDLAAMLPDVTIGSFLNGLQKMFALAFIFDHARLRVQMIPFKTLLTKIPEDWTSMCEPDPEVIFDGATGVELNYTFDGADSYISSALPPLSALNYIGEVQHFYDLPISSLGANDMYFVRQLNQYWKVITDGAGNAVQWLPYADALQSEKVTAIDGKETKITSSISTLGTAWNIGFGFNILDPNVMPQTNQVGKSTLQPLDESEFTPRLLFYRGFQDSWYTADGITYSAGENAPFGSNTNYLPFDDDPIGNYTLSWDGTNGLYEVWWRRWVEFLLATKRARHLIRMNLPVLKTIDLSNPVKIDTVPFFISKISLEIPLKKLSKIELWKK